MIVFKNSNIYSEGKITKKTHSIKSNIELDIELPKNLYLIPGFVDKHTHGANNSDCMYNTQEHIDNICLSKAKEGVTSFLATTMTASISDTKKAIDNIVYFIENNKLGKMIKGIHLEGPFLSNDYKGAQPESGIITGNIENFNKLVGDNIKYIKQITLAPENTSVELLTYLTNNKVLISIGHSNASYDLVKESMKLGLSGVTHTFNAQSPLHHREIGVVGSALLEDNLYPELICDLLHVSQNAIKLLYKCNKNICLITDSMEASHLEDGNYKLGGQKVILKNKEARLENNTLAGSVLKMNEACKNFKNTLNLKTEELVKFSSLNASKYLNINIDDEFVVVDDDFNVYCTIINGDITYNNLKAIKKENIT